MLPSARACGSHFHWPLPAILKKSVKPASRMLENKDMRQRTYRSPTLIHDARRLPATRSACPRRALTWCVSERWPAQVALAARDLLRRPLLLLTIGITCALLLGALGEAHEAARIETQAAQVQAQNERFQHQITQIGALTARLAQDDTIIAEAGRIGWTFDTP